MMGLGGRQQQHRRVCGGRPACGRVLGFCSLWPAIMRIVSTKAPILGIPPIHMVSEALMRAGVSSGGIWVRFSVDVAMRTSSAHVMCCRSAHSAAEWRGGHVSSLPTRPPRRSAAGKWPNLFSSLNGGRRLRRLPHVRYQHLWEALRKRVGERKACPLTRITIQCAYWLSWRGRTEPDLIRLREGLRQGLVEALLPWHILMDHTMAPLAAAWAEEKRGIWIPRNPTLTPSASKQEQPAGQKAEAQDLLNHATWAGDIFFVGACPKDLETNTAQTAEVLADQGHAIRDDQTPDV